MAIGFRVKDIVHSVVAKFVPAFLPEAKKAYNLRAVHQQELDIHAIASKAAVYNMQTSPEVIEEGMNAGMELIYYLVSDGFKIKTPLFNLRMRLPGEYDGSENAMPHGVYPVARMQTSARFRKYINQNVNIVMDGIDQSDGLMAEAIDEATGVIDEAMTIGNIITIRGNGLKIAGTPENSEAIGIYFEHTDTENPLPTVKAEIIAVNEPRRIKAIVPSTVQPGESYSVKIVTQTSAKGHHLVKELREMHSDFALTAQQ